MASTCAAFRLINQTSLPASVSTPPMAQPSAPAPKIQIFKACLPKGSGWILEKTYHVVYAMDKIHFIAKFNSTKPSL
jgi:hypothetical protein